MTYGHICTYHKNPCPGDFSIYVRELLLHKPDIRLLFTCNRIFRVLPCQFLFCGLVTDVNLLRHRHFRFIDSVNKTNIYTTKGRDRFHWAATPLKPYKVGNICYMKYRYSVLYTLNLSLKHFFPHRKRQFLLKYPNPETVILPCFNVSRIPNRRTSQSKIKDIVHCKCISLLN